MMNRKVATCWLKCTALSLVAASGPAIAQYVPPRQMTISPLGVNLVDGRLTYKSVDLSIGPLELERSYIGGAQKIPSKYFGKNWTHNFDIYVMEGNGLRLNDSFVQIGRRTVTFTIYAQNGFYADYPESIGSTLKVVSGAYVYETKEGDVYTFNPSVEAQAPNYANPRSQRVANIVYANGQRLDFTYSAGKLVRVQSNYGYAIVFEINAAGDISKSCAFNQTLAPVGTSCASALSTVTYTYATINASPALVSVQDRLGQTWGYDYTINGSAALTCIRQVNSSACLLQNAGGGRITQQIDANGGVWNYDISGNDPDFILLPGQPKEVTAGSVSGPAGLEISALFGGGLLTNYSENGRSTFLSWNGIMLTSLHHREGNSITYNYDEYNNATGESWTPKPNSGISAVSSFAAYPAHTPSWSSSECISYTRKACNKPLYRLDFRGNRTDYTWDQNSGQPLTEVGPADANGVRPVKRSAYAQRYTWLSNGGGFVQSATPIWVLATEKTCRTTATIGDACAGGAPDEVVTAFDYGPDSGPNNLSLRGVAVTADGATRRTCYGYDAMGNRIWETKPLAGLASCPAS